MTEEYMTAEAQELVDRARTLVPQLLERANDTDKNGIVPQESVDAIQKADLFRVLQPKRWGGHEMDPRVFYQIQMTLAEGCMSTAWIYGVIGVHYWQLSLFPEQAQQDVWTEDGSTRIASTYMPVGKAEKVDGGYRFSGHWGYSSGCEHCEWIFLGGLLPVADGSEEIEHVTFLLPKSDFKIVKNWDVLGLKGTGSHDIVVENAFVPEHRTQRTNNHSDVGCPGRQTNPGWLYKIPFTQVFQRAVSSACIGAMDGAIQYFRDKCSTHMGKHGNKTAEDVNAQLAVSEAMMTTDQLKLVLFRNYAEIVACAKQGTQMELNDRLMQRAQAAQVPKLCSRHIDELMRAMAASATYRDNPVERVFRDINQSRTHIANNTDLFTRAHGSVMLGLPNMDPFV